MSAENACFEVRPSGPSQHHFLARAMRNPDPNHVLRLGCSHLECWCLHCARVSLILDRRRQERIDRPFNTRLFFLFPSFSFSLTELMMRAWWWQGISAAPRSGVRCEGAVAETRSRDAERNVLRGWILEVHFAREMAS